MAFENLFKDRLADNLYRGPSFNASRYLGNSNSRFNQQLYNSPVASNSTISNRTRNLNRLGNKLDTNVQAKDNKEDPNANRTQAQNFWDTDSNNLFGRIIGEDTPENQAELQKAMLGESTNTRGLGLNAPGAQNNFVAPQQPIYQGLGRNDPEVQSVNSLTNPQLNFMGQNDIYNQSAQDVLGIKDPNNYLGSY